MRLIVRGYFSGRIYHADRVPKVGPVILASNHVSFADPPIIGTGLPRCLNFLARENLFKPPWFSRLIRTLNAIPVDRDGGGAAGLRTVLGRLEGGSAVLLFPEGTRTPDGAIRPAHSGIGLLVIRSTAPVVPVRLFGLYESWGRHRAFPWPRPIVIKYGRPLYFEALRVEAATANKPRVKAIYEEVSREIMTAIRELQPCRDVAEFPYPSPRTWRT